jgi:hypothetical protein
MYSRRKYEKLRFGLFGLFFLLYSFLVYHEDLDSLKMLRRSNAPYQLSDALVISQVMTSEAACAELPF